MRPAWVAGANVKPSVCRAFASWLRLTVEPFPAEAAQHLVHMVLEGLASKDTFDSAVDAVVEIIYRTAMWQDRQQLSPEWGAIVRAVLHVVGQMSCTLHVRVWCASQGKYG